jgi:hypothetical protein
MSLKSKKPPCPHGARRLSACKNYCFFSFAGSWAPLDDAEPLAGGVLEPLAELLLEGDELELGVLLVEPLALVEPPAAESFLVASDDEDELEDDGELGVDAPPETEPDAEPEGELGLVVEPADEDAPEPGVVLDAARSPSVRSQPVSKPAPSARETATAKA